MLSTQGNIQTFIINLLGSRVLDKAAGRVTCDAATSKHLTHSHCVRMGNRRRQLILSPDCSFCHFLLSVSREMLTPTVFSKDQVCGLFMLPNPGDEFHAKPDQQHPQCSIKDEVNKVAENRGKFKIQLYSSVFLKNLFFKYRHPFKKTHKLFKKIST